MRGTTCELWDLAPSSDYLVMLWRGHVWLQIQIFVCLCVFVFEGLWVMKFTCRWLPRYNLEGAHEEAEAGLVLRIRKVILNQLQISFTWWGELVEVSNSGVRPLVPLPRPRIRLRPVQHLLRVRCRRREILRRKFVAKFKISRWGFHGVPLRCLNPDKGVCRRRQPTSARVTICILCLSISCQQGSTVHSTDVAFLIMCSQFQ